MVTFADVDRLEAYAGHLDIDFWVVSDTDRSSYRAYGLDRGTLRAVYRWDTIKAYVRLLRAGRRMHRTTDDTRQLGGDFVLDPNGVIRFVYRPVAPDDRPSAAMMVDVARQLTGWRRP